MTSKYYLFDNRNDAHDMCDLLTEKWGECMPYTEVRESNNNKGYAVKDGAWSLEHTDIEPQELPQDFYIDDEIE